MQRLVYFALRPFGNSKFRVVYIYTLRSKKNLAVWTPLLRGLLRLRNMRNFYYPSRPKVAHSILKCLLTSHHLTNFFLVEFV